MYRIKPTYFTIGVLSFLLSCSPASEKKVNYSKNEVEQVTKEASNNTFNDKQRLDRAKEIYSILPTPMEASVILRDAGISFNQSFLNDPENAYTYQTSLAQAVNLGVFGTDLSFSAAYGQDSEVMSYFGSIKKLADDLHIANVFTEELLNEVEENINNQDVLMRLISDSYWGANNNLSANERSSVSTMIIAGGWLEAVYIAVKALDNDFSKKEIVNKIGQQRYTLELIMQLLNDGKQDSNVKKLYEDFEKINSIYARMDYSGESDSYKDPISGEEKKDVLKSVEVSNKDLKDLTETIISIRSMYIALS